MKCFAYISKAVTNSKSLIPNELIAILNKSRVKNREEGITGFISYCEGYYFQVVEGEASAVDALLTRLKRDPRHQNIRVILDEPIAQISFSEWDMKLIAAARQDPEVLRFFYRHRSKLLKNSPEKIGALKQFFKHPMFDEIQSEVLLAEPVYKEYEISLKSWPNFAQVPPSSEMIEICACLTHTPLSYEQLLVKCEGLSAQKIDVELERLCASSLLSYGEKNVAIPMPYQTSRKNTAYSRLKSFLSRL